MIDKTAEGTTVKPTNLPKSTTAIGGNRKGKGEIAHFQFFAYVAVKFEQLFSSLFNLRNVCLFYKIGIKEVRY